MIKKYIIIVNILLIQSLLPKGLVVFVPPSDQSNQAANQALAQKNAAAQAADAQKKQEQAKDQPKIVTSKVIATSDKDISKTNVINSADTKVNVNNSQPKVVDVKAADIKAPESKLLPPTTVKRNVPDAVIKALGRVAQKGKTFPTAALPINKNNDSKRASNA